MRPFPGGLLIFPFDEMCYRLIERYAVCRCRYYVHAVDPCVLYGYKGHSVEDRTLFVGYLCSRHDRLGHAGTSSSTTDHTYDRNYPVAGIDEWKEIDQNEYDTDNESPISNFDDGTGEPEPHLPVADSGYRETGRILATHRGSNLHGRRKATFPSIFWTLPWLLRFLGR